MLTGRVDDYMEGVCVICGEYYRVYDDPRKGTKHECPEEVLAAMKAEEQHAANIDDPLMPDIPDHLDDRLLTLDDRLTMGSHGYAGAA